MSSARRGVTLSDLFRVWDCTPTLIGGDNAADPHIEGVSLWEANGQYPVSSLVITPHSSLGNSLERFVETFLQSAPQISSIILVGWPDADLEYLAQHPIEIPLYAVPYKLSATFLFETALRETQDPTTAELRRLTSLQRSFTQELSSSSPTQGILNRLQKLSSAVALVVTPQGSVRENTGQIPLSTIFEQLSKTDSPSQFVSSGDWNGQAVRLHATQLPHGNGGWLVAACRRPNFPDASASAAIHIAASLIETVQSIDTQARSQEQAIRTSLFEQAIAFKPSKEAPELESRIAALGLSCDLPMRVLVTAPSSSRISKRQRAKLPEQHQFFEDIFSEADIVSLSTTHDEGSVFLLQASESGIQRVLRTHRKELKDHLFALGRNIQRVTETSDSYADAWLGVRTLRANPHLGNEISFEQFDFATRLFSNIGIDVMAEWSREFLEPILEREQILTGLREYFLNAQNIAVAADALGIHHNSLRYRLTKVEEMLNLNLRDPAAISSLFLAITSLDLAILSGQNPAKSPTLTNQPSTENGNIATNVAGFVTQKETGSRLGATLTRSGLHDPFASTLRR